MCRHYSQMNIGYFLTHPIGVLQLDAGLYKQKGAES